VIKFLSEEDLVNVPAITTTKILDKKRKQFDNDGLFSETIFGKNDNSCSCGNLKGVFYIGKTCDNCKTIVGDSNEFDRIGKLTFNSRYRVINPLIMEIIKKNEFDLLEKCNPQKKKIDLHGNPIGDEDELSFHKFIFNFEETLEKYFKNEELKDFLLKNKDCVFMKSIVVPPIHLRSASVDKSFKRIQIDALNKFYVSMLTHIVNIEEELVGLENEITVELELYELQKLLQKLFDEILDILAVKEGLIRDQLLSNRINFSGRAVLALKEDNDPFSITIPRIMFTEIFILKVIYHLVNNYSMNYLEAEDYYYHNRFDIKNEKINYTIKKILDTKPRIILNRNPSLHIFSLQSFFISAVTPDSVIRVSKEAYPAFNADLDGDTLALFTLDTEEAIEESMKLDITAQIFSRRSIEFSKNITPYQDGALGLYLLDYKNAIKD